MPKKSKIMYDKINIWIDRFLLDLNPMEIADYLTDTKGHFSTNNPKGLVINGNLNGLRITLRNTGMHIVGSLAKYYFNGNNIETLRRTDTENAILNLCEDLHTSILGGKVLSLEFGANILTEEPVSRYLHRLVSYPRQIRVSHSPNTLYFEPRGKEKNKVLCFYDKIAEMKEKGVNIPFELDSYNVMRYELRLKRLPKILGVQDVTPESLYNPEVYNRLTRLYVESYKKIKKMTQDTNTNKIRTVLDGFYLYVGQLIKQQDKSDIEGFVNDLKAMEVYKDNPAYYSRLKRKLLSMICPEKNSSDELIKELDNSVNNIQLYP